jgi:hypothetical protein
LFFVDGGGGGFFVLFFEIGSCYVPQTGLKVIILLPQSLKCWDYRYVPPCPDLKFGFVYSLSSGLHILLLIVSFYVACHLSIWREFEIPVVFKYINSHLVKGWTWWHMPVILALRKLRQENHEFKS